MKITVKETTMVKPMEETPGGTLWLSNLDLQMPTTYHSRSVYFFPHDSSADFFDAAVLKAALSRTLVLFYPFAGRLRQDNEGRLQIHCNAQGAVFVEAECDATLADLGDFSPTPDITFAAKADYTQGLYNWPLSLLQLTRFKCGGVSLGVTNDHHVCDGASGLNYVNTWSQIARGITTPPPPFIDRRILAARTPPQPKFTHTEYLPPPSVTIDEATPSAFKTFTLTLENLKDIKQSCNSGGASYTTYEAVAGHLWRCICMARRLPHEQETKMQIPVDARTRLKPKLPRNYFGNAVFYATPVALCGEIETKPLEFAVGKIHEAVARMDDEYMRSALDYVELRLSDISAIARSEANVRCPNVGITSWTRLPFYEADFGWGKPDFAGPAAAPFEGRGYLAIDPKTEGHMLLTIALLKPHLDLFQKLLYDI